MDTNLEDRNTDEWFSFFETTMWGVVLDPDGWDRKNLQNSINEKISFEEFKKRLIDSTVHSRKALFILSFEPV